MKPIFAGLALALGQPSAPPAPPPATPAQETPDPARLAAAERMIGVMMPPGTFRRAMSGAFGMEGMFDANSGMFGVEVGAAATDDPNAAERRRLTNEATAAAMTDLMAELEPDFRSLFARHYALRFTVGQLDELTAFFGTPTGRQYVDISMTMASDAAFMQGMMATLMPRMVEAFPRIEERVRAATAHLPVLPGTAVSDTGEDTDED